MVEYPPCDMNRGPSEKCPVYSTTSLKPRPYLSLSISLSFLIEIETAGIGTLRLMVKDTVQHTCDASVTSMQITE